MIRTRPRVLLKLIYSMIIEEKILLFTDLPVEQDQLSQKLTQYYSRQIAKATFKWAKLYYNQRTVKALQRFKRDLNYCVLKGYVTVNKPLGGSVSFQLTAKGLAHVDLHYRFDSLIDDIVLRHLLFIGIISTLVTVLVNLFFKQKTTVV